MSWLFPIQAEPHTILLVTKVAIDQGRIRIHILMDSFAVVQMVSSREILLGK